MYHWILCLFHGIRACLSYTVHEASIDPECGVRGICQPLRPLLGGHALLFFVPIGIHQVVMGDFLVQFLSLSRVYLLKFGGNSSPDTVLFQ